MFERVMSGLFGGAIVSLTAVSLASLVLGSRFELVCVQTGCGPWIYIGGWILSAACFTALRRAVLTWRTVLVSTAAAMAAAALTGVLISTPGALGFLLSLVGVAVVLIGVALGIGEHRVKRPKAKSARRPTLDLKRVPARQHYARALHGSLFIFSGWLFVEAFRFAYVASKDELRIGAGMVGMLIAFFVLLPGAAIATWLPRAAAALHLAGALALFGLALRAGHIQWALGAAAASILAIALVLRPATAVSAPPREEETA